MASADFTVRVRGKAGTWRFGGVSAGTTIGELKERVMTEKNVPVEEQVVSDKMGGDSLADGVTLGVLGAKHGTMLYVDFVKDIPVGELPKKIGKDGNIVSMTYEEAIKTKGYRPGVPALRDMQKQWKWSDFMDLQNSLSFKIKQQEGPHCTKATLDATMCNDFVMHLQSVAYQTSRIGYLYGRFTSDGGVKASAVYEPRQEAGPDGWVLLEDPDHGHVDLVASLLGLSRVGVIFSHPPRDKDFLFADHEWLAAAQAQLESGRAVDPSPEAKVPKTAFVTVRVSADSKGHGSIDAYQMSDQSLEMLQAGVLGLNPGNKKELKVDSKYSVVHGKKEGGSVVDREVSEVDPTFLITTVPINQYTSGLGAAFPKASRKGRGIIKEEFAAYLRNAKSKGMNFVQSLADFNLLVFMAAQPYLAACVPAVCEAILAGQTELQEGHKLLITSFAEVDV